MGERNECRGAKVPETSSSFVKEAATWRMRDDCRNQHECPFDLLNANLTLNEEGANTANWKLKFLRPPKFPGLRGT